MAINAVHTPLSIRAGKTNTEVQGQQGVFLAPAQVEMRRVRDGVTLADLQKATKGNNYDEIIFKAKNGEYFVVYADELSNLGDLKKGDQISVGAVEGTIEYVNDEINRPRATAMVVAGVALVAFIAVGGWTVAAPIWLGAAAEASAGSAALGLATGTAAAAGMTWLQTKSTAALEQAKMNAPVDEKLRALTQMVDQNTWTNAAYGSK